ncbi:MAG TPA: hypothetical protein VGD11_11755 [Mycobacteriales bacterium]
MRPRTTRYGVVLATALLTTVVLAAPASAAVPPVTHRTVFATEGGTLYRLALSSTGAVTARTPVAHGAGAVASDYDGRRLVFVRPGAADWTDDQVWVREPSGAGRFLATGRLGTFTPGRTGVAVARFVLAGRNPASMDPEHDELTVVRLSDGHVVPLSPHHDGDFDGSMRYSRDGRTLWMLTQSVGESGLWLQGYDLATDTVTRSYGLPALSTCTDVEMLPSGANALLTCGPRLLTVRLADGKVTHHTPLPRGTTATTLDGRLNSRTLLLSMSSGSRRFLGALDVDTMRVRTLPGSAGYTDAVTAY